MIKYKQEIRVLYDITHPLMLSSTVVFLEFTLDLTQFISDPLKSHQDSVLRNDQRGALGKL